MLTPFSVLICCATFKLSKVVQKDAEQESEMRAEIQEMKKEQASISMMDEFARYARLERKISKMTDKLKTHGERLSRLSEPRQRFEKPGRVKWKLTASTTHFYKHPTAGQVLPNWCDQEKHISTMDPHATILS